MTTADSPHAALPPQNLDAEESVLGAMMLSGHAIDASLDVGLAARDFYRASHARIFDAIVSLYASDEAVDALTVVDRLSQNGNLEKAGGAERVYDIGMLTPTASNARHYATIVREQSVLRTMLKAGHTLQRLAMERGAPVADLVEQAERAVFEMAIEGRAGDFVPLSEPLAESFRRLEELGEQGKDVIGVPSGFKRLDSMTSGFQPGNLVVVAARPSMGKSGLALNIAAHVAVGLGLPVALFTLEMSRHEVTQRMLSSEALVESGKIRNGRLTSDEWERLTAAAGRLHLAPLQIDDSGSLTAMEVRAKARRLKLRNPELALVIVDYIQLMSSGSNAENRQQDVSATSRALKVLAQDLQVPVIAVSQLSRAPEQRHDKRPILSDLRESGAVEQDADVVVFIYRDEYYHPEDTDQEGLAEINIAKHRNGATGTLKLAFVKRHTRFSDLVEEPR